MSTSSLLFRLAAITSLLFFGCEAEAPFAEGTFGHDLDILNAVEDIQVLQSGQSLVAVSGALQGRVFTSSADGLEGPSFGWFKRTAFKDGSFKKHYSGLGGEDRMWFGPQFGKYSVFFPPGAKDTDEEMRMAPDLDTLNFTVTKQTDQEIVSSGQLRIGNFQGYTFTLAAERKVSILDRPTIEGQLDITLSDKIKQVGFATQTTIENAGNAAWEKETGLLSIWILGCMVPSDSALAIIPFKGDMDTVTNYFTPLDGSRVKIKDSTVYYRADAN
ncbi:MAG: DUF6786 family protein, partial [Bacteroidota bacterium]